MPNDDQAAADFEAETPGVDPSGDASHDLDTNEATNLADYQDEVAKLLQPGDEPAEEEAATDEPEADPGNGEEEEEGPEDLEEEAPAASKPIRIRAKDEVEREALSLKKRHPEWSLSECENKAKALLGIPEKAAVTEETQPAARKVADVTAELADVKKELQEARASLDFEKVAELEERRDELTDEKTDLRIAEERQAKASESEQQVEFDKSLAKSERLAVRYYPDSTDAESSLTKRMIELDEKMQNLGDPLFHSPDKPFILAKLAAKELGIPMSDPDAAPARKNVSVTRRPVQPASGNARTTQPAASAKLEDAIGKVTDLRSYNDLVAGLAT